MDTPFFSERISQGVGFGEINAVINMNDGEGSMVKKSLPAKLQ